VRSVLYRFPDLEEFERLVRQLASTDAELAPPAGEPVEDGEWVLAIFELGPGRRATSAAGRATVSPDGARLVFEPRDQKRLAQFAAAEARVASPVGDTLTPAGPSFAPPPVLASDPSFVGSRPRIPSASRVLIVDDDPDIRDVVAAMLEAVGLTVLAAASAEDALERVAAEPFDLLVLDWNLPKMTGLDLCRAVRKDPALASLPVLFLTANASSQDMVEAFASGGDDFVVKPFRAPELGARIFGLLRRSRMGPSVT
jgi:two-component system, OmpR family, phosphate regulon response regulator PhoB